MKSRGFKITLAVLLAALAGMAWLRFRPPPAPPPPVDLTKHDGKTIDFSSGKPVIKDSPRDRAAIEKAKKEMDEAARGVTFGPSPKKTEPPPAPPPAPPPPSK